VHANVISRAAVRRGIGLVTTSAVLWGTVGVAGQLLYNTTDLSPLTVGFYRLLIAGILLVAVRAVTRRGRLFRITRAALPAVLLVGAGLAIYQVCYFAAVKAAGVSIATLVTLGLAPVLVAAGGAVFQREMPGRGVLVALASALAGLALLVGGMPSAPAGSGNALLGAALAVGSATGYAGVILLSRTLVGRVEAQDLTMFGFSAGAVLLLPVAAVTGLAVEPGLVSWGLLLYLGAVPSALAYGLFFTGLHTVTPTAAAILTLLEPLTAAALAAALFGERLGVPGLLGAGLLLAAVLLLYASQGSTRRQPAEIGTHG
jgi:drug/metabolite transporter, DME family